MEALRTWMASSQLIRWTSTSVLGRTKASTMVRCCSSSPLPTATDAATHRRRRSSSSTSDRESIRAIRLKKIEELRSKGYEPYAYKWDRSHKARQLQHIYAHLGNGEECKEDSVSVAGRVIASRKFGKLAFYTLRDESGTVQLYFEKESLPDDQLEFLKAYVDIGDILGASGSIKKTDKGELSVFVKFFKILTKSLLPLPDKYHGLTDVDKRYRQRYVDMIANPEVADIFRMRAEIISEIRKTIESWGFIEVETPVLQGAAGGAEARPFVTYHNSLERNLYLRIATELHLKRMLVGGFEKVFEIGRIFRNEGISTRHNPEFTTIEMYEAFSDYQSMMDKAEEMITRCVLKIHGKLNIDYLVVVARVRDETPQKKEKAKVIALQVEESECPSTSDCEERAGIEDLTMRSKQIRRMIQNKNYKYGKSRKHQPNLIENLLLTGMEVSNAITAANLDMFEPTVQI